MPRNKIHAKKKVKKIHAEGRSNCDFFTRSKKKIRAEGFTWKKIPAQALSEKKNSCKLKIPHPPHNFSNGPSLIYFQFDLPGWSVLTFGKRPDSLGWRATLVSRG